ncbi:MAG: SET domain-containing protein-lysine N-methyltransferase [Parcubacteria group bacterium]|nr:SET domain-containing protein-lysine N-methyltransferase [Parcubacteria group bacterium]
MKKIYIGLTEHKGRGVFASEDITSGELIECCPVLVLPENETQIIDTTILYNYYFGWGEHQNKAAIALGYGSIYNHSFTPNARYIKKIEQDKIEFVALQTIRRGEEILVNYNEDPSNKTPLWFEVYP